MNSSDTISIIIPVYNAQNYIANCLRSVLRQTYRNLEIILIDDGSTDNSAAILQKFATKDARIRLFLLPHSGIAYTRTFGIGQTNGEYIAFVDADDCVADCYIENMLTAIRTTKAQMAVCGVVHVDGNRKVGKVGSEPGIRQVFTGREYLLLMEQKTNYEKTVACWNKLYRKEVLKGMHYPSDRIYEDSAVMQEVIYPLKRVVDLSEVLYFYNVTSIGITRSQYNIDKLDEVRYALKRVRFFQNHREAQLYALSRKQLCIVLLKHDYLHTRYLHRQGQYAWLKKLEGTFLKKGKWMRALPILPKIAFGIARVCPTHVGCGIVVYDRFVKYKREKL